LLEKAQTCGYDMAVNDVTEPLVAGLLAGWGVAIPLGAIGVMIVETGMRGGLW
jgi:Na+-driven multidrug efflux pump